MIIYLDGPDGSGKSTLANEIARICKEEGYSFDRFAERNIATNPRGNYRIDAEHLFDELKYMAKDNTIHILDRGPISDNLYRMFDNYEPVAKLEDYLKLFKEFNKNKQMILIYTRTDAAEKAMLERGDDNPIAINRHKELSKAYDLIMGVINFNLNGKMILFDYTLPNATDKLLNKVKETLKENKELSK